MRLLDDFKEITRANEPLAPYTYLKIGGPAELFVCPRNLDELRAVVARCCEEGVRTRTLGGGSNLLVGDEGVPGVVLHLSAGEFTRIAIDGTTLRAGAGAQLHAVISQAVRAGLAGMETLVGIYGTVGGALHMNSGGRAGDIGQFTSRATVMNSLGDVHVRERDEMSFAYRQSSLDELVILEGEFQLEPDDPDEITKRMRKLWILKKASQPLGHQSAGCIFKNPRGLSAGMLIEQAGLKGTRIGEVEISERHANFFIAHPGARSNDVLRLIDLTRSKVLERFGIELELEIRVW